MQSTDQLDFAVVLAGGLGTRLGSLTSTVPKPLVKVGGVPYLEHQVGLLRQHGINKLLMLTGFLGDQVEEFFGSGESFGLAIDYSREPSPAGTGGALKLAAAKLPEVFFLLNGDTYLDVDYQSAYRAFRNLRAGGPFGLMVVAEVSGQGDAAGNVRLDPTGSRVAVYEKGSPDRYDYLDAGALVLSRECVEWLPDEPPSSLEEIIYPRLASEGRLIAFKATSKVYDIGTPQRLSAFERKFN
jgi:NDP-sugar pyrophosphorylase family protein